jgi:tetratricopeptide (TPR) repeat protein
VERIRGQYRDAVADLSQALEAGPDNEDYVRARGVAESLAEAFTPARKDLERAMKLNPRDQEARLWPGAAYEMSGDPMRASENYPPGGAIPEDYAALVYLQMATEYFVSKTQGQ